MSTETLLEEPELAGSLQRLWVSPLNSWRYTIIWLVLISPIFSRLWFLSKVPDVAVPFNVAAFSQVDIPKGLNSFDHYRDAARILDATRKSNHGQEISEPNAELVSILDRGWGCATESAIEWLTNLKVALAEWRCGTECQEALYIPLNEIHYGTALPVIDALRCLTLAATCIAIRLEAEGEFEESLRWHIAVLRCSRHCGSHAGYAERLAGCSIHKYPSTRLIEWAEDSRVSLELLRTALAQIIEADRLTNPMSSTLKSEFVMISNTLERSDWLQIADLAHGYSRRHPAVALMNMGYWLTGEPESTRRVLRYVLINQLAAIDLPLAEQRPSDIDSELLLYSENLSDSKTSARLNPTEIARGLQRSPVANHFISSDFRRVIASVALERERQTILVTALGAQAYKRDHGEFPLRLEQLVPDYLDQIPVDPTGQEGAPIQYRRENPTLATLQSVGIDEIFTNGLDSEFINSMTHEIRLKSGLD